MLGTMPYEPLEYHPAFEEYSETVFGLGEEGVEVIQARIAERLSVSRPAVSEMIRRMETEGLVEVDEGGRITLTDEGGELATTVVRRHRLAERFLTDVLGLGWTDAHSEAGRWEHVISPIVEAAMVKVLDNPTTCPHGNPIPGTNYVRPTRASALVDLGVGGQFRVERIPEELEHQKGQLAYLEQAGMTPGRVGEILAIAPDGTTTVSLDGVPMGLSAFAASRIIVTASSQPVSDSGNTRLSS